MMEQRSDFEPASVLIDGIHFPECLRWHDGCLFFADMYGDAVYAYDVTSGGLERVAEVFHPGGIGWLPDGRLLVVASEDRVIMEAARTGNRVYADLSGIAPGWVNDMLVDSNGRVFVGDFGYDLFSEEPQPTHLVVLDPDGRIRQQADAVVFPNGMAKRSDGRLVLAETFAHRLTIFTIEEDGGLRRESSISLGDAVPDGICIDSTDHIWVASVYDRAVLRVGERGEVERRQVSQMAFACTLGGEDGRTLFVATAPDFEPDRRRAERAGQIEAIRVEAPMATA